MKVTIEGPCRVKDLEEFIGIKERQIRDHVKNGILPSQGRGVFDFLETVRAYIRYLQDTVRGRTGVADEHELKVRKLKADTEEKEAKARKARYQVDVMEGRLLKLEEVARQFTGRYIELKAAMLELPKRIAFRFTDPEVRLRVEEEVNAFVVELLERYSRDGILPDSPVAAGNPEKSSEAPKGNDGKRMGRRKQNPRQ